jgi:hypothetical protein
MSAAKPPIVTAAPKKDGVPPVQSPAVTNGQLPVAMAGGQLPVVAKAVGRPIRALKQFADAAEYLREHYDRLQKVRKGLDKVCRNPRGADTPKYLEEGRWFERRDKHFREVARDLKVALEQFNPENAYDDNYQLTETRVRTHIAMLVGSIPNATPGNPEAYVGMMVEEVMATEGVTLPALESACSQIRRTVKFTPSISEVIEAIQEQIKLWEPRFDAIHDWDDAAGMLRDELKVATELVAVEPVKREEQRRAAAEKKAADDALRVQPLALGDRVCVGGKSGTIEEESSMGFTVVLDNACRVFLKPEHLKRLIPGDDNFELSDAKRAEIKRKRAEYDKENAEQLVAIAEQRAERVLERDDRVWHVGFGHGSVLDVSNFADGYRVQFDSGTVRSLHRDQLERRLPGWDDCGESARS